MSPSRVEQKNNDSEKKDKTPPKKSILEGKKDENKSDGFFNDEGMISEIEQARLLMAANENYFKSLEKTPVKQKTCQNYQSPQNSLIKNSPRTPGTPGRYKRAELITLASPKAKKLKTDYN